jgi:hypothetical protein
MNDVIERVLAFAKDWSLNLDVEYDTPWAGQVVHRMSLADNKDSDRGTNPVFFWVLPETERLCFYLPSDKTPSELAKMYALDVQGEDWPEAPSDMQVVSIDAKSLDPMHPTYRELMQFALQMRAQQVGCKIQKLVLATIGGCIGR